MTRPIILGNGNLLACFDKNGAIRDFYFPYVGQENHVTSNRHRTGIFVDGKFSWISRDTWNLSLNYKENSLVSEIIAYNEHLEVELVINEAVHPEKNILIRRVNIKNKSERNREIKIFFSQHFHISENNIGDTVFFNPILESIINYKEKRYFLIGGIHEKRSFDQYATGNSGEGGKEGTWKDAEDGFLSKNAIEHGSVDSTIGFTTNIDGSQSKFVDYWIAVGKKYNEVKELKDFIINQECGSLIEQTNNYWIEWLKRRQIDFHDLPESIQKLFWRSLLIIRAQTDNRGAIIAANDTHTFHFKKDTYSYMWPRDGALVARSLDRVGLHEVTGRFFNFVSDLITDDGYLLHKYNPDGSFGSSWHSWLKGDKLQLPIQEDETALILDALWKHYNTRPNKENEEYILHGPHGEHLSTHSKTPYEGDKMIQEMYDTFIKPAADFLQDFKDPETHLPKESYDLWEQKLGVHTFTCCTVYAGLIAAQNFANIFEKKDDAKKYGEAAEEVRNAILNHLWDETEKRFIKGIWYSDDGSLNHDKTIDASTAYGLFEFNVLHVDDPRCIQTMEKTYEALWNTHGCGGMARYPRDDYYRISPHAPENPWFISTMWLAEYRIAKAKNIEELKEAEEVLLWATKKALPSGALSEQVNPFTGESLSVAPLTWSHAGFIIATIKYIEKYEELINKN